MPVKHVAESSLKLKVPLQYFVTPSYLASKDLGPPVEMFTFTYKPPMRVGQKV